MILSILRWANVQIFENTCSALRFSIRPREWRDVNMNLEKYEGQGLGHKEWTCICGGKNYQNFCVYCGNPRSYAEANELDSGSEWRCTCGTINSDNFCIHCGKRRGEDASQSISNPSKQADAIEVQKERQDTNGNWKIALIGFGFLVIIGTAFFLERNDVALLDGQIHETENNKQETMQVASLSQETGTKKDLLAKSDLSLNGLDVGDEEKKMRDVLGVENSRKIQDNETFFCYDTVDVGVINGKIASFVSDSSNSMTKRGIHPGSSFQEVLSAYGSDYYKTNYGNLILYEYEFQSIDRETGLLRFAVNESDKKVNYISIRIPENDAKLRTKENSTEKLDYKVAIDVFYSFHRNITNKSYRQAYNCLSNDMQNHMSYDGWVPGFKTTVSSTPYDIKITSGDADHVVLTYVLRAVDNPGGTQEFNGTVTLIKIGDEWRINEIVNKAK